MATIDANQQDHGEQPAAPARDTGTPDRLLAMAMGFWHSALLLHAHELGLFTLLLAGPQDSAALSCHLKLCPEATADFLDALVGLGLLECTFGQYANTAEGNRFLDPAKPGYIGNWLAMAGAALQEFPELVQRLRAAFPRAGQHNLLASNMWDDIAAILQRHA